MSPREILRCLFDAAIAAADPALCVPPHLPPDDGGRLIVIGSGKASAAMARAVEDHWSGPLDGLVVTRSRSPLSGWDQSGLSIRRHDRSGDGRI